MTNSDDSFFLITISVDCLRLLLVADPQILGYSEPWLARYDSDRNLRKSFHSALLTAQPDYVIFLGDLMDEGSNANDRDFDSYFTRFMHIFRVPSNVIPIYISGDNDIGGEGFEPVKRDKIERFKRHFGKHTSWSDRNVDFYNMNLISREIPPADSNYTARASPPPTSVVLSHYEVLSSYLSGKLLRQLHPPVVIFSAHNHESAEIFSRLGNRLDSQLSALLNGRIYNMTAFEGARVYLEVQVPTCSYRMGTLTVGYGQAIFDGNQLRYTPMFFMSRYYQFLVYLLFLIVLCACNAVFYCKSSSRKKNMNLKYEKLNSNDF